MFKNLQLLQQLKKELVAEKKAANNSSSKGSKSSPTASKGRTFASQNSSHQQSSADGKRNFPEKRKSIQGKARKFYSPEEEARNSQENKSLEASSMHQGHQGERGRERAPAHHVSKTAGKVKNKAKFFTLKVGKREIKYSNALLDPERAELLVNCNSNTADPDYEKICAATRQYCQGYECHCFYDDDKKIAHPVANGILTIHLKGYGFIKTRKNSYFVTPKECQKAYNGAQVGFVEFKSERGLGANIKSLTAPEFCFLVQVVNTNPPQAVFAGENSSGENSSAYDLDLTNIRSYYGAEIPPLAKGQYYLAYFPDPNRKIKGEGELLLEAIFFICAADDPQAEFKKACASNLPIEDRYRPFPISSYPGEEKEFANQDKGERCDLRSLPFLSIDGENTKDIDDLLLIREVDTNTLPLAQPLTETEAKAFLSAHSSDYYCQNLILHREFYRLLISVREDFEQALAEDNWSRALELIEEAKACIASKFTISPALAAYLPKLDLPLLKAFYYFSDKDPTQEYRAQKEELYSYQDSANAQGWQNANLHLPSKTKYLLGVAIADPSAYFAEGSKLDDFARNILPNTAYFPNGSIHMLASSLVEKYISLLPDNDRLALVSFLYFDAEFKFLGMEVRIAQVKNHAQLDYGTSSSYLESLYGLEDADAPKAKEQENKEQENKEQKNKEQEKETQVAQEKETEAQEVKEQEKEAQVAQEQSSQEATKHSAPNIPNQVEAQTLASSLFAGHALSSHHIAQSLELLYKFYLGRKDFRLNYQKPMINSQNNMKFTFNDEGECIDIKVVPFGVANNIVSECMLCNNGCLAKFSYVKEIPVFYLRQGGFATISEKSVRSFIDYLHDYEGIDLSYFKVLNKEEIINLNYQSFLRLCRLVANKDLALAEFFNRFMSSSSYEKEPSLHFGTGEAVYSYFTSPIRRYVDLYNQRRIKNYLWNLSEDNLDADYRIPQTAYKKINAHLSDYYIDQYLSRQSEEREVVVNYLLPNFLMINDPVTNIKARMFYKELLNREDEELAVDLLCNYQGFINKTRFTIGDKLVGKIVGGKKGRLFHLSNNFNDDGNDSDEGEDSFNLDDSQDNY